MWEQIIKATREEMESLDREIELWTAQYTKEGGRIHCSRGCSGCCTLMVRTTLPEALLVATELSGEAEGRLDRYLQRLRQHLADFTDLKSCLKLHRTVLGPCPFLEPNGACGVYTVRPFACRSLLSTRPGQWCATDFTALHPLEREAFLSSLDREVVAFPTHYVAAVQEIGREAEEGSIYRMREAFGFSLSGSLPLLVHLEREYGFGAAAGEGIEAVRELLEESGLDHPLLVSLEG